MVAAIIYVGVALPALDNAFRAAVSIAAALYLVSLIKGQQVEIGCAGPLQRAGVVCDDVAG
ncbi:MAG: hypothetical protein ABI603_02405 [Acidobacteriota bacterium]